MPIKNFSSIGGYAVAATEVLNTSKALKNISAMHMVSDHFTDANKDIFILKRQTDAANNTQQLSLDGNTPIATNTPPLVNDSVSFATATVFGFFRYDFGTQKNPGGSGWFGYLYSNQICPV